MKLSIILKTSEYRGDHGADVNIAYELQDNEKEGVTALATRLMTSLNESDVIEIRRIVETVRARK